MVRRVLFLLPLGYAVSAFSGLVPPIATTRSSTRRSADVKTRVFSPLFMGGASGYASSLAGKTASIEKIKGLLDTSEMIFTVPSGSMSVAETQVLRRSMPEGTTCAVVKNKLMERAVQGTDYEAATSLLQGPNMWFFIEEDIGGTISAFKTFTKGYSKQESHPLRGGVVEGTAYDAKGVEAIGKLPSKQELYAKIAGSIKAVPTKVARIIKAPSNKVVRAIKLATMPDE